MKIVVGADHAGFPIKDLVMNHIKSLGHSVIEVGCFDSTPVDFPDIALEVGKEIINGEADRGIMICGTGAGACMAANKVPGIRATLAHDTHTAHQCVEHDNANVICIGGQIVGPWLVLDLVEAYLSAEYHPAEEYERRINKITEMERKFFKNSL